MRYIVDVKKYVADGPGTELTESVDNYPQEIPSTQLRHTVGSLSEILNRKTLYYLFFLSSKGSI